MSMQLPEQLPATAESAASILLSVSSSHDKLREGGPTKQRSKSTSTSKSKKDEHEGAKSSLSSNRSRSRSRSNSHSRSRSRSQSQSQSQSARSSPAAPSSSMQSMQLSASANLGVASPPHNLAHQRDAQTRRAELQEMKRSDLQRLAKNELIVANQSSADLVEQLLYCEFGGGPILRVGSQQHD